MTVLLAHSGSCNHRNKTIMSVRFTKGLTILKEACLGASERDLVADCLLTHLSSRADASLLDVGSGSGVVLRKILRAVGARNVDIRATCVEPHPVGPWQLFQSAGMQVVEGRFEETTFHTSFDLVTCLQALYYFQSPLSVLERLASLMRAEGLMLITLWAPLLLPAAN